MNADTKLRENFKNLVAVIKTKLSLKQDKLTAGDNITITSNTISATDTVYDDTSIQTELGKKADKTYVDNKVKTDVPLNAKFTDTIVDISGKQDKLIAGDNISIVNGVISAIDTVYDDEFVVFRQNNSAQNVTNLTSEDISISPDNTTYSFSPYIQKTNNTLENYTEKIQNITNTIDLSLANVFIDTPTTNRIYSIINAKSEVSHLFTLQVNMGDTIRILTFPENIKWKNGEMPNIKPNKTYILKFMTTDGGANWFCVSKGEF